MKNGLKTPGNNNYIYPEIAFNDGLKNQGSKGYTFRHSNLPGDVTISRAVNLNTPGETSSQVSAGEGTFTYWTGTTDGGLGKNPWITTATGTPELGSYVKVRAVMDEQDPILLYQGYVDQMQGGLHSPKVDFTLKDPVDAFERTFSSPALMSKNVPMTINGNWAGEQDDLLGPWDRRLWVHPATGNIVNGVSPDHKSTLNANAIVSVPLERALRRAGYGIVPPVTPGRTIASVPFEGSHHLNPEFGAYLKRYTDTTVTYGLTFNGWDKVNTQVYDLCFSIVPDGSKVTFRSDDGKVSVSVYWDSTAGGFVMKDDVGGKSTTLKNIYMGPKTSFYRLSLLIERTSSTRSRFTLVGLNPNPIANSMADGTTIYAYTPKKSSALTLNSISNPSGYVGSGAPPFTVTDSVTSRPVGGVWEVMFTKAPTTTDPRAWMFGGFIMEHCRDGKTVTETWKQNMRSDNHFGGVADAVLPRFENVKVADVVSQWCAAYCASMWRSRDGWLQLRHYTFFSDPSTIEEDAHVVKTSDDWLADSFTWEKSMENSKSSISVRYRVGQLSRSATAAPTVVAANATATTNMQPGDTFYWKFTPEDGKDWIGTSYLASPNQTAQPAVYVDGLPAYSMVDCAKNDPSSSSTEPPWQHVPVQMFRIGMGGIRVKVTNNNDYRLSLTGLIKEGGEGSTERSSYRANTPIAMTHTLVTWKTLTRTQLIQPQQDIDEDTGTAATPLPVIAPGSATNNPPEGADAVDPTKVQMVKEGVPVDDQFWIFTSTKGDNITPEAGMKWTFTLPPYMAPYNGKYGQGVVVDENGNNLGTVAADIGKPGGTYTVTVNKIGSKYIIFNFSWVPVRVDWPKYTGKQHKFSYSATFPSKSQSVYNGSVNGQMMYLELPPGPHFGSPPADYEGPRPEGEYSHDGDYVFGNLTPSQQDDLFAFMWNDCAGKTPTAREIQIYPDSRIELGDAIDLRIDRLSVEDPQNPGTYNVASQTVLQGRIMAIKDVLSNGKWEQFIKVRSFQVT